MTDPTDLVLHLVHGTRAPGAPWTKEGSRFQRRLLADLRERDVTQPVEFVAPQWGGRNSHAARLAAAQIVREDVRANARRGRAQFLIGHSHGGSACVLACRDGADGVAADVTGVVCLSTPFLVFRRAPYLRWIYLGCWVAWWVVAMFAARFVIDSALVAAALALPVPILFAVFLAWALRRGYADPEVISAPSKLAVPSLLIRCPGDEASGVLGASLIVERVLVVIAGNAGAVWAWLRHHWLVYLLVAILVGIAVPAAMFASMALSGSLAPLKWPSILLGASLAAVLVLPLLVAWPIRSLVYGISYGLDVATRGVFLHVTAESTPLGRWKLHTILPRQSESVPGMAHSEPYDNDEAIERIARWIARRVKDRGQES